MRNRDPKKKQKGQETTIGKIIYGFLLFLPLLAIGVTCGYAMFNKNAYQSFSGNTSFEGQVSLSQLEGDFNTKSNWTTNIVNQNYSYKDNLYFSSITIPNLTYESSYWLGFNITSETYISGVEILETTKSIVISQNISYRWLRIQQNNYLIDENSQFNINELPLPNYTSIEAIIYTSDNTIWTNFGSGINPSIFLDNIIVNTYFVQNDLSNVFYYSIDKVQQSPLFNWAENSIIYTTTASTCTALSITTPFIPLLMSYWLIISVIYFLYDIALMLVWIIHRKIHELQESI